MFYYLLIFIFLSHCAYADNFVTYNIQHINNTPTPHFKIQLYFDSGEFEQFILNLPSSDIHQMKISSIEPKEIKYIDNKLFPDYPTLIVPKHTKINIHYDVFNNTNISNKFRTMIDSDKFIFYGKDLFIIPSHNYLKVNDKISASIHWQINNTFISNSYNLASANLPSQAFNTSGEDILESVFIGGNYHTSSILAKSPTLSIAFDLPESKINQYFTPIEQIITYQRMRFEDNDFSKVLVILKENKDLSEGEIVASKWHNIILLQATQNTFEEYPERVLSAFSHENMHFWFSERLYAVDKIYARWFFEGFNDYFGLKAVHDLQLISTQYYLEYLNGFILTNRFLPGESISSDKIETDYNKSPLLFYQPYARGHLFAIELNHLLNINSNHTRDLNYFFKTYLKNSKTHKNEFKISDFDLLIQEKTGSNFFAQYKTLKQQYIIEGKPILLSADSMAPLFNYTEVDASENDVGFDFYTTITTGVITDVKKGGHAYKNGLRNNQKLISYDYDINKRFDPIILKIKTKDQHQKTITVPIVKVPTTLKIFTLANK